MLRPWLNMPDSPGGSGCYTEYAPLLVNLRFDSRVLLYYDCSAGIPARRAGVPEPGFCCPGAWAYAPLDHPHGFPAPRSMLRLTWRHNIGRYGDTRYLHPILTKVHGFDQLPVGDRQLQYISTNYNSKTEAAIMLSLSDVGYSWH